MTALFLAGIASVATLPKEYHIDCSTWPGVVTVDFDVRITAMDGTISETTIQVAGGTPSLVLTGNTWIAFNTTTNANSKGGGLFLGRGSVTLSGVTFETNTATYGDGLYACQGTLGIQELGGVTYINDTWYEE